MQPPQLVKVVQKLQLAVALIALLLLAGCEGGLVGTGTGPTAETSEASEPYELKNLPDRISPDIPRTILTGEDKNTTPKENANRTVARRNLARVMSIESPTKALGWQEMNSELIFVNYIRTLAKSNATFVDLAFDDIREQCAQQLVDCSLPSGTIRVTVTQDVVNRLIDLQTEWAESLSALFAEDADIVLWDENDFANSIKDQFTALLGTEVVFGETSYSQLGGAPYDHIVSTFLQRKSPDPGDNNLLVNPLAPWRDETFVVRWREDKTLAKFRTSAENQPVFEFFYQNGAPGELATVNLIGESIDSENSTDDVIGESTELESFSFHAKVVGNDSTNAGILLDLVSLSPVYTSVSTSESSEVVTMAADEIADPEENEPVTTQEPVDSSPDVEPPPPDLQIDTNAEPLPPNEIAFDFIQGQMDNNGGYTTYESRTESLDNTQSRHFHYIYRESFDSSGALLAGEQCASDPVLGPKDCEGNNFETYGPEGNSLVDSEHYFEPGSFTTLITLQDIITWEVQGLPIEIEEIAVVSADQTIELSEREILCRGNQYKRGEVHIFCSATDEQLENSLVVTLTNGLLGRVVTEARLVQAQ